MDAPIADRLTQTTSHFGADFGDDRELLRLLARHTRLLDGRHTEGPYAEHRRLVRELLADGQRRGEVATDISPAQLAEIYEATVVATVEGWLDDDSEDERLADRMGRAIRLLLRGCAPPT